MVVWLIDWAHSRIKAEVEYQEGIFILRQPPGPSSCHTLMLSEVIDKTNSEKKKKKKKKTASVIMFLPTATCSILDKTVLS